MRTGPYFRVSGKFNLSAGLADKVEDVSAQLPPGAVPSRLRIGKLSLVPPAGPSQFWVTLTLDAARWQVTG